MKRMTFVIITVVLLLGLWGVAQMDFFPEEDYVEIDDIAMEGNTIAIASGCKALIAETSEERAQAILYGLQGVIEDRPTIYDAFAEVLDAYNMSVVSMAIERRDDKFYYSNIILQGPVQVLKLDIKPSDAMALALRTNATMYIKRELLESDGVEWCLEGEE